MNMNSIIPIDFNDLWRQGIYDWAGNIPERMKNDSSEKLFWKNSVVNRELIYNPPAYVQDFQIEIIKLIEEQDYVLEIGVGWGDYTVPIARKCSSLSCADISMDNLAYTQNLVKKYAKKEVSIFADKWEEFNSDIQFDVIVGVNCFYRMFDMRACITNMINHAKKRVILAMTTGPIQEYYQEIYEELGYEIKVPKRDYIFILNILYEMGIYANCKVVKLKKEYYYNSIDEALQNCRRKIVEQNLDEMKVKNILMKYLKKTPNNEFVYVHHFHGAIISFDK